MEVQLFKHLVKFHSSEKRDWWCVFKNATNTSTKPVLQLSCFTYTTFKHHWNGDILNSCWSLQLGQGLFILFQLTVATVQNSQSENSQADEGCCCESLQKKSLEGCQRCHKYSAQLFQTNPCEVKLGTFSVPGLKVMCTGWHSLYWPLCRSKGRDQERRWSQGWTFCFISALSDSNAIVISNHQSLNQTAFSFHWLTSAWIPPPVF